MEANEFTFLGLDLAGLITLPTLLVMFAFAVWWAVTRYTVGIDEEEQARRMDVHRGFEPAPVPPGRDVGRAAHGGRG